VSLAITRRGGDQTATERAGRHADTFGNDLGFRRIECVRILVDGERTTAEVTGVVHRYPRTKRIPVATAARLIAAGAPLALEHWTDRR
jgi:hypothetical protein